ncbi:STAS domain-containing protein [Frigoriglobus tundricola]|uniref:STAS domain-containing protein n=1 Tax=Frigoriglobus tundricola TaxID=2774151 RepID=UPI00148EB354|nr:STAS domain-containing protein [Frigoriglobus tundricola]
MDASDLFTVTTDPAAPGRARLGLCGRITVTDAAALKRAALDLVARGVDVTIDCSAVEYLDVSAVQLLMCLDRELGRCGHRGALAGVSPALATDLRLLGLGAAPPAPAEKPASRWHEAIQAVADHSAR